MHVVLTTNATIVKVKVIFAYLNRPAILTNDVIIARDAIFVFIRVDCGRAVVADCYGHHIPHTLLIDTPATSGKNTVIVSPTVKRNRMPHIIAFFILFPLQLCYIIRRYNPNMLNTCLFVAGNLAVVHAKRE